MSERLFDTDSLLLEFDATVLACEPYENGYRTVLDKTAFCPEGGGQPSDLGTLGGIALTDVREEEETVFHLMPSPLAVGKTVHGSVDALRRLRHMQNHTGEHIVTGIFYNRYHLSNIGFHLGHEDVTLDLDGEVDNATLRLVEWEANRIVAENRTVFAYYPSKTELESLSYRSKKEPKGRIRIVEIEGHDRCACCVPHVKHTGEVGGVRLLSAMRYKGGTRIHMKCGMDAIADANVNADRIAALSHLLSLPGDRLLDGVKKLTEELAKAKYELTALRRETAMAHAEEVGIQNGKACLWESELALPDLRRIADRLLERGATTVLVCSENDKGCSFVFADTSGNFEFSSASLRAAFPLRGGGKAPYMQGTLIADRQAILSYFI